MRPVRASAAEHGAEGSLPGTFRWEVVQDAAGGTNGSYGDLQGIADESTPLPPGDYTVRLRASHFCADPQRVTVAAGGESAIRIPLRSATEVRFTFVTESGAPIAGDVEVQVLHLETRVELQRLKTPGGEPLVLDLEPLGYARTFVASARSAAGEDLSGGISGYLSGGHRSNHDFEIKLRPVKR